MGVSLRVPGIMAMATPLMEGQMRGAIHCFGSSQGGELITDQKYDVVASEKGTKRETYLMKVDFHLFHYLILNNISTIQMLWICLQVFVRTFVDLLIV